MAPKKRLVDAKMAAGAAPAPSSPAVDNPHRNTEASLLFWLHAVTDDSSVRRPAPTIHAATQDASVCSAAPSSHTLASTIHTTREPMQQQDGRRASSDSLPSDANQLQPIETLGAHRSTSEMATASANAPPLSSSRPNRHLAVHDVMPLYDALLAGQLGPVVLDVQLQGHTRLLQHPQQFKATLQGYEKQSAGPLREALRNVQPFFLLCHHAVEGRSSHSPSFSLQQVADNARVATTGTAAPPSSTPTAAVLPTQVLYTMDPSSNYPVVPLLAQLLHSPSVTKVLLHSRLLYRLLFLFLGTDRVDIQQVVDLTTWSELGRQLRPSLATMYAIPVDGVVELANVQSALPNEVRQLLEEEMCTMAQQRRPALRGWQHTNEDETDASTTEDASEDQSVVSSLYEDRSESGGNSSGSSDDDDGILNEATKVPDARDTGKCGGEEDESSGEDAVRLLHTIVPIDRQPLHSVTAASKGGSAKRPRQRPRHGHRRPGRQKRCLRLGNSSTDNGALASVYHDLKSLTMFYTEVLPKFLDNVTGTVAPSAQAHMASFASSPPSPAVRCRLSPSEWCVQRTYAEFLCEAMTYHGVFVNDSVYYGMKTALGEQLQALEDLAEHVLAVLERGSSRNPDSVQTSVAACMTAEHIRQCLARGPAAMLLTAHPKLDVSLLHALAKEAAAQQDTEGAVQLRLSCQLVCIWIAFQERTEVKQKITDMFGKVADRVQARVLEHPHDITTAASAVDRRRSPSSWSEMCFSVHPTWTLHNASTGRIFSTLPNVQNLSRKPQLTTFTVRTLHATQAQGSETPPLPYGAVDVPLAEDVERWVRLTNVDAHASALLFLEQPRWTMRHLYRAPPGCVLASFDFNQLELRVLAQLSGDATLQQHLSSSVDVLTLTTASLLQLPSADCVQPHQRQAVKVIVYGLLYGMGPKAMEERIRRLQQESPLSAQGNVDGGGDNTNRNTAGRVVPLTAHQLIARFHQVYPRVEGYLREVRQEGLHHFSVETLSGRKSLAHATDANRRKQRAVAQAIQGGAADIVLCAMRAVHQQRHTILPYLPAAPLALVMAIHDELIYAVPRIAVDAVARTVKRILENQARAMRLAVPLLVSVRVGKNCGALEEYRCE
ncbi:putative DNA polymerase theta (polymerase domain only) [Leptomonas seymouri]|uniref:DNA-directed DNA polymerase n=1 Tax=Leptomonas seymouri TaxID=5684 RepID=A0A0N0P6B8_LEPSE|nr:putative DNA polymerase theta (polymerase domain only) [Leptomonas seymouri]|eukprot:KPI86977.1 putative DNA polymerase theta (polymerase domain only) [Leptomonas seymouri]